jgi:hypothetical protein
MATATIDLKEYENMTAELEKLRENNKRLIENITDYFKRFDKNILEKVITPTFFSACSKCGSLHHSVRTLYTDVTRGVSYDLCEQCRQKYYFKFAVTNFSKVAEFVEDDE